VAVYERTYRSYDGTLTPRQWRFLVLPRYSIEEVFRSKLFLILPSLGLLWMVGCCIPIYLPHNSKILAMLGEEGSEIASALFQFGPRFFQRWVVLPYAALSLVISMIVGPALVAADLRNNGLPLYLARPFGRWDYVLGKATVLFFLLSAVTWVPGTLLFLFQAYLGGTEWLSKNWHIGVAIPLGFIVWIVVLCLLNLAISAYVKWKPVARIVLLFVCFGTFPLAAIINFNLDTQWANTLNILLMFNVLIRGLLRMGSTGSVPVIGAWISLDAFCALSLVLLSRKLRAYEVVR
jgi:ABC-2 type transport system permease protein